MAGAFGVAGVLVGVTAAAMVLHEKSAVDRHCVPGCDAAGDTAQSQGRVWSSVATAGFAVGLVGLGAGTYLWVTRQSPATQLVSQGSPKGVSLGIGGTF